MCTASWRIERDGYDLFFNRDELHSRAAELPPAECEREGVRFLAPADGDRGGTWLLANEFGVTVCLLNDYLAPWRPAPGGPRHSRGHVVLAAADLDAPEGIMERVRGQPLELIAPFRLLAMGVGCEPVILHWTGAALTRVSRAGGPPMLTSSSFAPAEVMAARQANYLRMVPDAPAPAVEALARFHRQHDPATGAYSVAMCRADAATRSFIQVTAGREEVVLRYERAEWPRLASGKIPRRAEPETERLALRVTARESRS